MNKVTEFRSKEDIREQACLWVTRIDRGLSDHEQSELSIWIKLSKRHQKVLFEVAAHWDNLSILNELSTLFPLDRPSQKINKKWQNLALAASVALFSVVLTKLFVSTEPWFTKSVSPLVKTTRYLTPIGQQARYSLSDGSSIQLNTNSIVTIDFTEHYRKLTLVRGEARFDVAKDKNRPFIVSSGMQKFTALGTIFNVQQTNPSHVELLVTEGRVLLSPASAQIDDIISSMSTSQSNLSDDDLFGKIVTSGHKAVVDKNTTLPIESISLENIQRELAWQQGMLIFNGEPLSKALTEVNRYTQQEFKILDQALLNIPVSGYFTTDNIDDLLSTLTTNFNLTAIRVDNNTIGLTSDKG